MALFPHMRGVSGGMACQQRVRGRCLKGRILSFDENAALVWARPMSEGRAAGKPRSAST